MLFYILPSFWIELILATEMYKNIWCIPAAQVIEMYHQIISAYTYNWWKYCKSRYMNRSCIYWCNIWMPNIAIAFNLPSHYLSQLSDWILFYWSPFYLSLEAQCPVAKVFVVPMSHSVKIVCDYKVYCWKEYREHVSFF